MKTGWTFEDEMELLRLYFLERKSLKETARAMGREPKTVQEKLTRLRTSPLQIPYKSAGSGQRPRSPAKERGPVIRSREDYPIATIPRMKRTGTKDGPNKLPRQPYRPFTVKETAH